MNPPVIHSIMTEGQFDEQVRRIEHLIDLKMDSLPCEEIKLLIKKDIEQLNERMRRIESSVSRLQLFFLGNIIALIGVLCSILINFSK